jgi:hypothetical protein
VTVRGESRFADVETKSHFALIVSLRVHPPFEKPFQFTVISLGADPMKKSKILFQKTPTNTEPKLRHMSAKKSYEHFTSTSRPAFLI